MAALVVVCGCCYDAHADGKGRISVVLLVTVYIHGCEEESFARQRIDGHVKVHDG